jgi:3-hydroxyacyl-CoA dehydrogenase
VAKAKISAGDRAAALRRIVPSSRYEDLGPVDLLIEAVPGNRTNTSATCRSLSVQRREIKKHRPWRRFRLVATTARTDAWTD